MMDSNRKTDKTYQEYFTKEHDLLRSALRDWVKKEVLPNIDEWEENCEFPRELYEMAGELGFLGIGFPEEVGGTSGDIFDSVVVNEELMRSGSGGFAAGIGSLGIALPPIVNKGTPEQKEKFATFNKEGIRNFISG